jgi:hypothetical protein
MPDVRFFHRAGPFPLREIAALVGAEPLGPEAEAVSIHDIGPLDRPAPTTSSVFTDVRYRDSRADAGPRSSSAGTSRGMPPIRAGSST